MAASFISRYAIGFIIFNIELPVPARLKAAIVGIGLKPDMFTLIINDKQKTSPDLH